MRRTGWIKLSGIYLFLAIEFAMFETFGSFVVILCANLVTLFLSLALVRWLGQAILDRRSRSVATSSDLVIVHLRYATASAKANLAESVFIMLTCGLAPYLLGFREEEYVAIGGALSGFLIISRAKLAIFPRMYIRSAADLLWHTRGFEVLTLVNAVLALLAATIVLHLRDGSSGIHGRRQLVLLGVAATLAIVETYAAVQNWRRHRLAMPTWASTYSGARTLTFALTFWASVGGVLGACWGFAESFIESGLDKVGVDSAAYAGIGGVIGTFAGLLFFVALSVSAK